MKKFIAIATSLVICLCMAAQPQGNKQGQSGNRREFSPEQYKKDMIEFVTAQAKLTEAEAANAFPIINEMHEKQHKLMKQQRELMKKGRNATNLSEAEYENLVVKATEIDVEIKKLEQVYFKKLHSVLSWKKIYAVRMALNRFQMEALRKFRPGPDRGNRPN